MFLCLLHWQVDSLPPVPPGKPLYNRNYYYPHFTDEENEQFSYGYTAGEWQRKLPILGPYVPYNAAFYIVWASSQFTQVVPSSVAEFLNKIQLTKFLMNIVIDM